MTILVADDDHVNRLVASRLISRARAGVEVVLAENGDQAVELFKASNPALVIMDIQMPGKDGREATREIRAGESRDPGVPIIALSAGTIGEERQRCLDAGMNDFLAKPITADRVRELLDRWIPQQ